MSSPFVRDKVESVTSRELNVKRKSREIHRHALKLCMEMLLEKTEGKRCDNVHKNPHENANLLQR